MARSASPEPFRSADEDPREPARQVSNLLLVLERAWNMPAPMTSSCSHRLFIALAAVSALAVLSSPAQAEEPERIIIVDPDAYPPPSARVPTLVAGAALTGIFYGGAVGASYVWPDARGAQDLRIPVVGPWMKLVQTGCSDTNPGCNTVWLVLGAVAAGLDGLGQAGGIGLLLEGIFMQTRSPASTAQPALRRDSTTKGELATRTGFSWYPVPVSAGVDGVGLGVAGAF